MSVSLVQGDLFQRTVYANAAPAAGQSGGKDKKHAHTDQLIADFNKAVTAYSTSHQQYISALLGGTATKAKLDELEQTATLKYQDVIATGTKVTSRTKDLVKQDSDAKYGAQIREMEDRWRFNTRWGY